MSLLEVFRAITLGLVAANVVAGLFLRRKFPDEWRYLILPGAVLLNLLVYLSFVYTHIPLDAGEIVLVNAWSSAIRIQALVSLLGVQVVLLWLKKF